MKQKVSCDKTTDFRCAYFPRVLIPIHQIETSICWYHDEQLMCVGEEANEPLTTTTTNFHVIVLHRSITGSLSSRRLLADKLMIDILFYTVIWTEL
jgi:hypothetical protein